MTYLSCISEASQTLRTDALGATASLNKVSRTFTFPFLKLVVVLSIYTLLCQAIWAIPLGRPTSETDGITIVMDDALLRVDHDDPNDPIISISVLHHATLVLMVEGCGETSCQVPVHTLPSGIYSIGVKTQQGLEYKQVMSKG